MRLSSCRRTRHDGWCLDVGNHSRVRPRKRAEQCQVVLRIGAVVLGVERAPRAVDECNCNCKARTPLLSKS